MPFLYAKQFPALCVTETESDPKNIRYNGIQPYPVEMSLEQAMALVWKPRKFTIETSFTIEVQECVSSCVYVSGNISGTSDDNSEHANLAKMSDLICLESYYPEYALVGQTDPYTDCDGGITPETEISAFLSININTNPIIPQSFPIYSYNPSGVIGAEKYYLCMFYGIGAGVGNLDDNSSTANAGNFTISLAGLDAITFPIYAPPSTGICDNPVASATFTMTTERETS